MIDIKSLNKSFGDLKVFQCFNMTVEDGEKVCLFGPSGAGKSTLLKILSGLDQKYDGEIIGLENLKVSYVFQEPRLIPWLTVNENLKYVLKGQMADEKLDDHVKTFIDHVKLNGFGDAYPNTLSGGMKQRVSLARAFAMPHDLLLLDEPFQGLDQALKDDLMKLLEKLIQMDKKTLIMVTHDRKEAERLSDRIVIIDQNNICK